VENLDQMGRLNIMKSDKLMPYNKCRKCKLLPLCNGGCRKRVFNSLDDDFYHSIKGYEKDFV
jgi:radical SAM protein with 4Fe4S-binding SPASM domain